LRGGLEAVGGEQVSVAQLPVELADRCEDLGRAANAIFAAFTNTTTLLVRASLIDPASKRRPLEIDIMRAIFKRLMRKTRKGARGLSL